MKNWIDIIRENPQGHANFGLGTLHGLDMAPHEPLLATGGTVGVVLWNYRERRVIARLGIEIAPIDVVTFSLDGKYLAAIGQKYAVSIFDVAENRCLHTVNLKSEDEAESGDLESLRMQFDPTSSRLLVLEADQAWLVDEENVQCLTSEEGPLAEKDVVGFSATGEIVVLEDGATAFYRADSDAFEKTREIRFHGDTKNARINADGRFLFARDLQSKPAHYAVVDLETGHVLTQMEVAGTLYAVFLAAACPMLIMQTQDGSRVITFPERKDASVRVLKDEGRLEKIGVFSHWLLAPRGEFIVSADSYGGDIHFRDLDGAEPFPKLGRYIYDSDSGVAMLGLDDRAERCVLWGFIGDGQNSSAWVQSWDLKNDRPLSILTDEAAFFCTGIPWIPHTDDVVVPTDSGILLAHRSTGKRRDVEDDDSYQGVAVGRDGTIVAAGSANGYLVLWDIATLEVLARVQAHQNQICAVGWQKNGDVIATTSQDETVRFWSAKQLLDTKEAEGAENAKVQPLAKVSLGQMLYQAVFSPDGALCAVGAGDGSARVIHVADGRVIGTFRGHEAEVMALSFHPQTGELVTGGLDGSWAIWNVATNELLAKFEADEKPVNCDMPLGIAGIEFDARGETFFLARGDGLIRQWRLIST